MTLARPLPADAQHIEPTSRPTSLVILVALAIWLFTAPFAAAAPSADLWERWTAHNPNSAEVIDHSAWDGFLKTYVSKHSNGVNVVDYSKVSGADRERLENYLTALSRVQISAFNRTEQFAYWANLYNALTVKVILDHYPVDTIRDIDISPGFFANGPWGAKLITVEGEELSLDDIEHRIMRPIWQDPRVHYAVNCAAMGCPNLGKDAFTSASLDTMLDAGARAFVNHPRGVQVRGGRLLVSSIYDWFEEDFGGNDAGVIAHLKQYAEPSLKGQLEGISSISDDGYDWSLNDAKVTPVRSSSSSSSSSSSERPRRWGSKSSFIDRFGSDGGGAGGGGS